MITPYTDRIAKLAPDYDPRHVEAYMRLEHSTLDHLADWQFADEVKLCCECIDVGGLDEAEQCAQSFGL